MHSYAFGDFFHYKIYVFIIFFSFFNEPSDFRNKILTNQKQELVVQDYQRNCVDTWKNIMERDK